MPKYLIGIDAGTTAFKGAIYDEQGNCVMLHTVPCPLLYPGENMVECAPDTYESVLSELISGLFEKTGIDPASVLALAIDSQGETLICVDDRGETLRNAIVWLDNRASIQADQIRDCFGIKTIYETTGQPDVSAGWPACKIKWLEQNEPFVYKHTYKYLLLEDYLIFKLTGKFVTERSLVSSSIYYDINTGNWWDDMLKYTGIDSSQLPDIKDSGCYVANVSATGAKRYGLSLNTAIVTGALDQLAGMIGAGVFEEGMACETTGTCLSMCLPASSIPSYDPALNIPCHAGTDSNSYYQIYWSQTAGAVLEWFKNSFFPDLSASDNALYEMDKQAEKIPAGSSGLVILPHLSGTAFPEFNAYAKGVFFGIGFEHTRAHFTRAIMESTAYMLNEFLEFASKKGFLPKEIRSLGGGSKSSLWSHIKADVTGKRIVTLKNTEAACLGSAILAGKGIGLYDSIKTAALRFVKTNETFEPDTSNVLYKDGYETYKQLYNSLKNVYRRDHD